MKVLAVAAAFVILAGGGLSFFVARAAFAATDALSSANAALDSARRHTLDYDTQLKAITGTSSPTNNANSNANFVQLKQEADAIGAKLDQVQAGVRADRASLGRSDQQVQAANRNPLVVPFRSNLDRSHQRISSLISALAAADTAVGIERDEIRATSAFMDMMSDYDTLDSKEKAGDIPGSLAVFTTLDPKVQAALQAAQSPNIPAQETALVKAIAATVPDEKAVLQASQAHDANRARAALAKFDADSAVVEKLDTSQIESEEKTLLQPYIDRYESGVKAAGFKLV